MPATTRKNTPRLRDGAMKRGTTWSYVIRVKDPYTGARRGELLNLRWQDIDLDLAEVRITGSAAVIGGQRIEGTTKSGRSRTVSIDPGTAQVLRDHRKRQAGERLRVGPSGAALTTTCSPPPGASRFTPTRCRRL